MAENVTAPVQVAVEAVQIMLFARSLGDDNPCFVDLANPQKLVAPLTFTQTLQHFIPDYKFRPQPNRPWMGSGAALTGVPTSTGAMTLHAEQHFEYHATVRPGDVLTATTRPGKSWQKPGRNGLMKFYEEITEFRNQRQELAVVSTLVGVTIVPAEAAGD